MIKFKIIIPFYNVEKWIKLNIESVLAQTYKNYECFYVDDMSTDNTVNILSSYKDERINIIKNTEKKYALQNIYETIIFSNPDDEDVIVLLDGDDWLYTDKALEAVENCYKDNTLLTYGNYIHSSSRTIPANVKSYEDNIIKNNLFRNDTWRASHLRTFKYKLWKNIDLQDLKDSNFKFYRMAWDLAIMFPMLEMSSERTKCINDILYVYNTSNPLNDHKVNHALQLKYDHEIRNKKKYSRIDL